MAREAAKKLKKERGVVLYFRKVTILLCVILALAGSYPASGSSDAGDVTELSSAIGAGMLSAAVLETRGATIGNIYVVNDNIFDLSNPKESSWLYRTANGAHIKTKPRIIRQQLLFKPGDVYSKQVVDESERILRGKRYLYDSTIRPVHYGNGVVDLQVETTDVWTLSPSISFGRKGGENTGSIGIKEQNLFGTGIKIGTSYKSGVDRESAGIVFHDTQLGSSWIGLYAAIAKNSDGHKRVLTIDRPFVSLNSRGAGGFSYLNDDREVPIYELGEPLSTFRQRTRAYEGYGGWSRGLQSGGTYRYIAGVGFEEDQFEPVIGNVLPTLAMPANRRFVYPFIGIEYLQDRFEKTKNHDQINRTEDRYLGTRINAKIGLARTAFGSSRDAYLVSAHAQRGFGQLNRNSLMLQSDLSFRLANSATENVMLTGSAKFYNRQSEKRLLYVKLTGTYGNDLDIDSQVLLGGDNGLRGYPQRYQSGKKSVLLTIEQRYFTDWYPFRLFHVGGAVFFDAGRTWGTNPLGNGGLGLLKDVGFGLRIGNSRSGIGRMTHIDIAFPLDGEQSIGNAQLLIELKQSF